MSAVYFPLVRSPWITIRDQVRPLLAYLWHGTPIADSVAGLPDAWSFRYGPVFYLVVHPLALVARHREETLYLLLLIVGHACFWASLLLLERRFFSDAAWPIRLLVVAGALTFTPALEAMACACLDTWELLAIVAALFVLTSSRRAMRHVAGIPAMLGVLTKLMPLLVFVLVFLRDRVAGVVGLATAALVLTTAQILYGPLLGWGFPVRAIAIARDQVQDAARWWENDSLRGIVYKTLAGFTVATDKPRVVLDPAAKAIVDVSMSLLAAAVMVVVWRTLWRWPDDDALEADRTLGAFAIAIGCFHLLSPYSTHQYWPTTLLCFAFVLRAALRGLVRRSEALTALVALVLVGNVAPKSVVAWLTGVGRLNAALGSIQRFDPPQMYTFYGVPGLGLLLLTIVVWRLQRRLVQPRMTRRIPAVVS